MSSNKTKAAPLLRKKLLDSAFEEFYRHGYQAGSLNRIVEKAEATKGALFYHFANKQELGYAVLDEVIAPILKKRWIDPVADAEGPIVAMKRCFRRLVEEDIKSESFLLGCPLNNLAQEMSPLDEGFRKRVEKLYAKWRKSLAASLVEQKKAGNVRSDISVKESAMMLVLAQTGVWGVGKYTQDPDLMRRAAEAVCEHLDSLKARVN